MGFYGGYTLIIDITDNPGVCSFIFSFVTDFVCGRLKIRTKKVDVGSITEQLATGDFIKRGPDYVLCHKSNKGEIIFGLLSLSNNVIPKDRQWKCQPLHG